MKNTEIFEIGLVGAGAISAGAYTAGVIDFMIHALDSWYVAKSIEEESLSETKKYLRMKSCYQCFLVLRQAV